MASRLHALQWTISRLYMFLLPHLFENVEAISILTPLASVAKRGKLPLQNVLRETFRTLEDKYLCFNSAVLTNYDVF